MKEAGNDTRRVRVRRGKIMHRNKENGKIDKTKGEPS